MRDDPPAPYMIIAGLHSIFLPTVDFAECTITNGESFPIVSLLAEACRYGASQDRCVWLHRAFLFVPPFASDPDAERPGGVKAAGPHSRQVVAAFVADEH